MTQNARLLTYLESHPAGITTFEAMFNLGIARLSERIRECERLGWTFEHRAETTPKGSRLIRYVLISQPESRAA